MCVAIATTFVDFDIRAVFHWEEAEGMQRTSTLAQCGQIINFSILLLNIDHGDC